METTKNTKRKKTKLKIYLFDKEITQQAIKDFTGLSGGAVSKIVSTGKGNKSTIKLVALFLEMSDKEFAKLLEFEK
jgi:hypothetical protein